MIKPSLALLAALCVTAVCAQTAETDRYGVTTSTDPAKVAAIERHAAELRAAQGANPSPAVEGVGVRHKHLAKHHLAKHHHRRHHRHRVVTKTSGPATTTTTTTTTTKP